MMDLPRAGLPKRWQKFGDLVLIPSGVTLTPSDLATISAKYKVSRIAQQNPIQRDEIRTPNAELLVGTGTELVQKENGVSYAYDFTRNMFSRGNVSEKIRFSALDVTDEVIIDLFVGIGYWVLQLAKHQRPKRLVCVDKNPDAIDALKRNISLNKLESDKFDIILSDCMEVSGLVGNRILLGLIPCCCFAIPKAIQLLDQSQVGYVHVHHNFTESTGAARSDSGSNLIHLSCCEEKRRSGTHDRQVAIESECTSAGDLFDLANEFGHAFRRADSHILTIRLLKSSRVKSYAPHVYHFVFDFAVYFNSSS